MRNAAVKKSLLSARSLESFFETWTANVKSSEVYVLSLHFQFSGTAEWSAISLRYS